MPGHFSISIRRDVCLLPASSCNRASSDQLHLVSRRHVAEARRVVTLRGTTVLLYAKHHETSDWSNLLHWLSACLYVAIATGLSVKANTTAVRGLPPVQGVLLPQVSSSKRWCGNATVPGSVPALFGRGAYSEMFLLSAFATVSAVADALGSARPRQMAGLRTTLCDTQRPVCMDALVYSDPRHPGPARQAAILGIKSAWRHEPHQTVTLCRRWAKTAATLAGVEGGSAGPRAARTATTMLPVTPRKVVLLTRRTQSVWTNRAEAAVQLRALVHTRGGTFLDAGNAEDLGVQEQRGRCYLARPQVELWRRGAFAVVSPVGAHLTNLVFMPGALGGLVQSNNCGFATETYEILARACGVRFAASHETQRKGARCPVPPRGQAGFNAVMLDSPRTMQIERADTLGAVVRSTMQVSLGLCPGGDAACKPARGAKVRRTSAFLRPLVDSAEKASKGQHAGSVGSVALSVGPVNSSGSSGLKGRARWEQRAQWARRATRTQAPGH